ncbi:hypothetical protein R3P38DRAFT_2785853 [Favolaschia claudopus]|uniref:Uncharacterized protein n=1 Tax=Favolaschia claudopus TaxID=2862362 RepID=A0AAW0ATA6_9AGAR
MRLVPCVSRPLCVPVLARLRLCLRDRPPSHTTPWCGAVGPATLRSAEASVRSGCARRPRTKVSLWRDKAMRRPVRWKLSGSGVPDAQMALLRSRRAVSGAVHDFGSAESSTLRKLRGRCAMLEIRAFSDSTNLGQEASHHHIRVDPRAMTKKSSYNVRVQACRRRSSHLITTRKVSARVPSPQCDRMQSCIDSIKRAAREREGSAVGATTAAPVLVGDQEEPAVVHQTGDTKVEGGIAARVMSPAASEGFARPRAVAHAGAAEQTAQSEEQRTSSAAG